MISRRNFLATPLVAAAAAQSKFRIAIVGTEHGHVQGFLRQAQARQDVEILGPFPFAERTRIKGQSADALACFTSTDRHPAVAELAGDLKLPFMMEKPLAVSNEAARAIADISRATGIPVLVNYETTWYRSHASLHRYFLEENSAGRIRKMVAMDGHAGPQEIGVHPDFLAWLKDPARNGAGALFDFGCYGANLMTWLMGNQRPRRVTARIQTLKPDRYSPVDDEASILLEYDGAQGIIQASWNWPFSRKDFEVYGERAHAHAYGPLIVRQRTPGAKAETTFEAPPLAANQANSISHLMAVARREVAPNALSSLENNLIATEILVAARASAQRA
ncbi:MAG: gfo/Idh/MocA family oxidoreductase [Bryobacter sp.]|nr:gfo/Idh/MocA family oxidoreductase [Bryobacter sp.]